jgi:hypothetical protein
MGFQGRLMSDGEAQAVLRALTEHYTNSTTVVVNSASSTAQPGGTITSRATRISSVASSLSPAAETRAVMGEAQRPQSDEVLRWSFGGEHGWTQPGTRR